MALIKEKNNGGETHVPASPFFRNSAEVHSICGREFEREEYYYQMDNYLPSCIFCKKQSLGCELSHVIPGGFLGRDREYKFISYRGINRDGRELLVLLATEGGEPDQMEFNRILNANFMRNRLKKIEKKLWNFIYGEENSKGLDELIEAHEIAKNSLEVCGG